MFQFSFEVGILAIFGRLEASYREELKKNYTIVERGYNSFPTKIPGTPYQKALQVSNRPTFHVGMHFSSVKIQIAIN